MQDRIYKKRTYTVTVTSPEGEIVRTVPATIWVEFGGEIYSYNTSNPEPSREELIQAGQTTPQATIGAAVYEAFRADVEKLPRDWATS